MSKLILVTGSAGFIGTNLTIRLLQEGCFVIGIDNFCSSNKRNVDLFHENPNFEFIQSDISEDPINELLSASRLVKQQGKIDQIYNLACPASPPRYLKLPLETIKACTIGMTNLLEVAKKHGSSILQASTSEIYGDPLEHPQKESYRGNVNTVGPRSCYDEGKRIAETICYEYRKNFNVDVKLARIFNTYGPYMDADDGRVVSNFINQALIGNSITIYGDGNQTRSFQYISDLIDGLIKLMNSSKEIFGPVNLGNPIEFTIKELAELVLQMTYSHSQIVYKDLPTDDPKMRKPDITEAESKLGWKPQVGLEKGLEKTIQYFRNL